MYRVLRQASSIQEMMICIFWPMSTQALWQTSGSPRFCETFRKHFEDWLAQRPQPTRRVLGIYIEKVVKILTKSRIMWDERPASVRVVQYRVGHEKTDIQPIYTSSYRAVQKARQFEKQEINQTPDKHDNASAQWRGRFLLFCPCEIRNSSL